MKKLAFIGFGLCVVCMLASCKSSESAYKKAYEQAKQQELAILPHKRCINRAVNLGAGDGITLVVYKLGK